MPQLWLGQREPPVPVSLQRQEGRDRQQVRCFSQVRELIPRIPVVPGQHSFKDLEQIFLSPCLGFLMCELGKVRCGRQGGWVTLGSHTTFPCYFSLVTVNWFPKTQQSL